MGKGNAVVSDEEDEVMFEEDEREPIPGNDSETGSHDDDDDEDEEDEGPDEYEQDGFLVDDVDEEEEEEERADSNEEERQKKKKRKKREEYVLDEDDYELLEDNNVFAPRRKGKLKRLKKAQRHAEGEPGGLSDEEFSGSAEEKLKRTLFGDDEGPQLEDIAEEEEPAEVKDDGEVGEEDEMADFIVDEEFDVAGAPVRRRKFKRRKSTGVSSSSLQEAHEIFGDVDELLQLRKQDLGSSELRDRRLQDEFEPSVLSEKYMTEKDDQIREFDVPERTQIYEESSGSPPLDDSSVKAESTWIYKQLTSGTIPFHGKIGLGNSISRDDIKRFLTLQHEKKLDIPFIAIYRKEECASLLKDPEHLELEDENQDKNKNTSELKWHKVLWTIQDLDRKWLLLHKRKRSLQSYYSKRFEVESGRIYDDTRLTLNQQLFESVMESLGAADSEREVDDANTQFNLHFPPGEVSVDEGQHKRPNRNSLYTICSKAGLWQVVSKFGYSSEQFGQQLSLEKMRRMGELEDAKETPEEMASKFICASFETPQAVLKGARHMAAVEISCEPCVRKYVRSNYLDIIELSTSPTPDGNIAIDASHQFAGVKWLQRKPLNKFEDAQWLLIQKAEEEKLLQVNIKLPEDRLNYLISEFNDNYLSDGVSKSAQLWNEQRKLILQDALFNFLLPSMEKEARSMLTSRAKNWLLVEYGKCLWNKVSVGPYQPKENDGSSNPELAPRVMACFWGPGKPATTFVMLDSSGEVLDVLHTGSLTLRTNNANDQKLKTDDQERVMKFMIDHQPHVVVLGGVNLSCASLKDDIYEIIFKMVEEHPRDVGEDMDGLSIVYGEESLARLYENSQISSDQLPGQSGIVKKAVALGRYLQNPLAMVATLCGPRREILSWKLNAFENFLTPDEKYAMVEQVMVDVTNQVGLDINLAINHEWLIAPLQFISGLGPRKVASLQRSLVRSGAIFSRMDFVEVHGLGKKVFVNAIGFLCVSRSGLAATSDRPIDLFDDTRIHPESYSLAEELVKYVGVDGGKYLKNLDVEAYAKSKRCENKLQTLCDIRRELIQGFQDWRKKYEEPSQDEEFYMISGETEDTLAEGRTVQARVRRVQADRVQLSLESGLAGMLMKEDYHPDDWRNVSDLSERLHEGDILTCKIKSIQKKRYQVFLVCRSLQNEQEKAHKGKQLVKKNFEQRRIIHPHFHNISADESMKLLADKDPGESLFRPSSRGPSHLTLTLKVYDGVYAHKDIAEGGKGKDITSLLGIGKTLKIGEGTFDDLDEVIYRYVDPLVAHLKAMLNYRKFRRGRKAEVDELLRIEKLEYPMRIAYCFGISHEHPGTIILTYIRSTNPHHEYVGVYPNGFKFRKRMFDDIDRLVAYFQLHIDDPRRESGPSIRSVAAMVPMRSPANRISSGASAGSGWGGSTNEGGWRSQSSFGRDRSSASSSRTGRNGGSRDGHPSGLPRPYGGHGRGTYNNEIGNSITNKNERQEHGNDVKVGKDGFANFPGARVQNSPGREAFPGCWANGGSGSSWGQGSGGGGAYDAAAADSGTSGWGSDPKRRRFR